MPTYGYQCKTCHHSFEVFQKITDPTITACEKCGAAVKKKLYPVGIHFKGSGFHVNDYAKSSAPATPAAAESKSEPAKTETPKTETKSETPAPAASAS